MQCPGYVVPLAMFEFGTPLNLSSSFDGSKVIRVVRPGKKDCWLGLWHLVNNIPAKVGTSRKSWWQVPTWTVWQLHSWIRLLSAQRTSCCCPCGRQCLVLGRESGNLHKIPSKEYFCKYFANIFTNILQIFLQIFCKYFYKYFANILWATVLGVGERIWKLA